MSIESGLASQGLSVVCETCESDIDFPDDRTTETGVCRQCGIAFLLDPVPAAATRVS